VLVLSLGAALLLLGSIPAQTGEGKKVALLVGIRDYDSAKFDDLKWTENDVEEMAAVLAHNSWQVRLLTTTRGKRNDAAAATAANIRAAIKALLANRTRPDTILIALAGHGVHCKVKDGARDESFFCPSDAQLNDTDKLIALGKLFKDLDDCGAGTKLLLVDASRSDPQMGLDVDSLPRLPGGTAALFSCSSRERAFESAKLGRGHGVFFYHVIEGLKGEAKNRRGEVTWDGLVEHVRENVCDRVQALIGDAAKQTPAVMVNLRGKSPVLIRMDRGVGGTGREVTNSIGMKLVRIPAGTFSMGSPAMESGRNKEELQHEVEITKAFWVGAHEVTQAQFQKVMGFNPSHFSAAGKGKDKVKGMSTSDLPVENVSWNDAVELCRKLSDLPAERSARRRYRLPSEAEWEYACRAGTTTPFYFGNSLSSRQANFNGNYPYGSAGKYDYLERTCNVGSNKPNRFGLHDMHGNVAEWCSDWDALDYYQKSPRRDPQGPSAGVQRVIRGGSWSDFSISCRSAARGVREPSCRGHDVGFRVIMVPSQE
jgi:formylglycine-generating enzyme required for sulfatase activity